MLFVLLRDVGRFLRWIFFAKDLASTRQSVNVSVRVTDGKAFICEGFYVLLSLILS